MDKWFVGVVVLLVVALIYGVSNLSNNSNSKNVAVIPIEGLIMSNKQAGLLSSKVASSDEILKLIDSAKKDVRIKGVIFKINSPGGSVVGSKEIGNAIKKLGKPSVAVIREVGASGGYWVASSSDFIIADEMSITGSIGVIGSGLEYSGLMEKYGVSYNRLIAGEFKDTGTPYREMSVQEKQIMLSKLGLIHEAFIKEIASNRNLSYENVKKIANGEFYLGVQAKEFGLIDSFGGLNEGKEYFKRTLNVTDVKLVEKKTKIGLIDALTSAFFEGMFFVGKGISSGFSETNYGNNEILLV